MLLMPGWSEDSRHDMPEPRLTQSDRRRARTRWVLLLAVQASIVVGASLFLLFRGYVAGPIEPINYVGCLLVGVAASFGIGCIPRSLLEDEDWLMVEFGRILAWVCPISAFLAWLIMTMLLMALIEGWRFPLPIVVTNPFVYGMVTSGLGLLLCASIIGCMWLIGTCRRRFAMRTRGWNFE